MPGTRSPQRRTSTCLAIALLIFPAAAYGAEEGPWASLPPLSGSLVLGFQDTPATVDAFEAKPVVIRLDDGSRLRGTVVGETDTTYTFDSDQLGQIEVPKASVVELLDPAVALGPPPPGAEAPPPPGLLGTGLLAGWDKSIAIGFTGKTGTTDSLDLYSKFSGDYSDEERRWRVRASYFYGLVEDENTKNEGLANARRDWLWPDEKLFLWGEGRADYNEFKDYRARLGLFTGLGYTFVDRDTLKILSRLGGGASYEFGDVDDLKPEALASVEADWKLSDRQSLSFINTIFPDLDDVGEYRNFTEASYTIKVETGRGLSVKLGVQNEYDSVTEDDSQHNAFTYFAALQLDF